MTFIIVQLVNLYYVAVFCIHPTDEGSSWNNCLAEEIQESTHFLQMFDRNLLADGFLE